MNDNELEQIEARANAIPSDPFVIEVKSPDGYECPVCEGEGEVGFARYDGPAPFAAGWEAYGIGDDLNAMEQFAKHARADIPALIAEVRRLREVIEDAWIAFDDNKPEKAQAIVREEICKDLQQAQVTPAAANATGDITPSTSSGEHGSPEQSTPAEFADPITRLALEAMREAESDSNVQTCNLLMALSTSVALRGVSNKEAELRQENAKLRELIKLSSDMEDEMPGCRACVQRHDAEKIAGGASITELHEGYHLMQLERYNKLVDRYNALYSEVFPK